MNFYIGTDDNVTTSDKKGMMVNTTDPRSEENMEMESGLGLQIR